MNATNPDRCLDAETLAAWLDGGLDAAAVAAAEAHVSNCDRCQALVATVMKTLPAEAAAAPAGGRLWRWWLAPIAAATAAVVIWAVVPQRSMDMVSVQESRPPVVATEPASPPEFAPQPASPPATAPQASGARDNAQQPLRAEPVTPPAPRRAQEFADASKRPAETDRLAANREARADAVAPAAPPAEALPPPAAVPLPAAVPPREAAPSPAAAPRAAAAETALAREEKAADRAAPVAGAPAQPEMQKRMQQAELLEVVSPDRARRWRVAADQSVERTEDGGRTWRQVRSAQGDTITAGDAASPTVCWIVGRNGLVLLTTDGSRFTRIAFPAQADLTGVTAINARTATVVTADGRTFRTDDGGATWRQ